MRFVVVILTAFVLAASVCAQQKPAKVMPDFSGAWAIDREKSNVQVSVERTLRTAHKDPEFRYAFEYETNGQIRTGQEFIYYTDGRGEKNQSTSSLSTSENPKQLPGSTLTASKTVWKGNKIETRSQLRSIIAGHVLEFDIVDEWKLSDDGQTLTQTESIIYRGGAAAFIAANRPDRKTVYRRINK